MYGPALTAGVVATHRQRLVEVARRRRLLRRPSAEISARG